MYLVSEDANDLTPGSLRRSFVVFGWHAYIWPALEKHFIHAQKSDEQHSSALSENATVSMLTRAQSKREYADDLQV